MITGEQNGNVVRIAKEAAKAHAEGATVYRPADVEHPQDFDLVEGGMCLRFVAQCQECGQGLEPFAWFARKGRAIWSIEALDQADYCIGEWVAEDLLRPGDILGKHSGTYGHIMLYVGDGMVAENTSASNRGTPRRAGTKLTPYEECSSGITHVFRIAEPQRGIIVQDAGDGHVYTRRGEMRVDEVWAPVADMIRGMGRTPQWNGPQRKVYVV
jgi:hypothetical protein